MEKHINLLSILYIVYGAFHLLASLVGWIILRWSGLFHGTVSSEVAGSFLLLNGVIAAILLFVVIFSVLAILAGVQLRHRKQWAKYTLLVLSFLSLIHFPLGTALGVYGIWVLMNDETDKLFPSGAAPVAQQGNPVVH